MANMTNPGNVLFTDSTGQPVDVSATKPLPVTLTTGGTDQDVNLVGINGVAPVTGAGTAAGALRVELPTDGTGKVSQPPR